MFTTFRRRTPGTSEPSAASTRLPTLDVLRAVALLGIFLVNIEFMARPIESVGFGIERGLAGADAVAAWFAYTFAYGKFWLLFALLFGAGFALLEQRDHELVGRPYLRRIGALFVLGMAHAVVLWAGDVLHSYALAALVLMAILRGRTGLLLLPVPIGLAFLVMGGGKPMLGAVIAFLLFAAASAWIARGGVDRLWKAGVAMYCITSLIILAMSLPGALSVPDAAAQSDLAVRLAGLERELSDARQVNAAGSWIANARMRWEFAAAGLPRESALLVWVVGMFLIGTWAARSGVLTAPAQHRPLLRRAVRIALPVGAVASLLGVSMATHYHPLEQPFFGVATQIMTLGALPLGLGYGALVLLSLLRWPRLAFLAPAGRMALTNYLVQSALGTWIFLGYGAGQSGAIGRVGQYALVLAIFVMQVLVSRWWLQRHAFGPAEWAWRAITYGAWPRWRMRERAAVPATAG